MKPKLEKVVQFARNLVISGTYAILPTSLAYYSYHLLNNYGGLKQWLNAGIR